MSGLLSSQGFDVNELMQLMNQYRMQQSDPFTKMIPGEQYLGGGFNKGMQGMSSAVGGQSSMMGFESPQAPGADLRIPFPGYNAPFAGVKGLPNLPDSFTGFGFGQTAPRRIGLGTVRGKDVAKLFSRKSNRYDNLR